MSQHLLAADRLAARRRAPSCCTRAIRSARTRSSSPSTRAWASAWSRASTASPSRSRSSPRSPPSPPSASCRALPRTAGALRRRPRLHGRLLLRPGRLQGDDAGALRPRLRPRPARGDPQPDWRELPLRFVPAALIAVGSVYTYSFPGLLWLVGDRGRSGSLVELARDRAASARPRRRGALRAACWRCSLFVVLVAPEIGRMIDFHSFETFDPNGPGLGNLFGQISPFEALGIWPSGDFRLAPGDGAVPALGYYLGAAFATSCSLYGLVLCWRRREIGDPRRPRRRRARSTRPPGSAALPTPPPRRSRSRAPLRCALTSSLAAACCAARSALRSTSLAAGGCSLLALANAPVGPTSYSPALTGLRPLVADGSTLVLASDAAARRRTRRPATSPGSCAAAASASRPRAKRARQPPPGRPLRRHRRRRRRAALPGPAPAPRRAALRALGTTRRRSRPQPLPADRRPPGPPGPAR